MLQVQLRHRVRHVVLKNCLSGPFRTHFQTRSLLTLAIETSCDDTCVAVLETQSLNSRDGAGHGPPGASETSHVPIDLSHSPALLHFNEKVTANNTAYRGIHPLIALQSHQESLAPLIQRALAALPDVSSATEPSRSSKILNVQGCSALKRKPDFVSVTRGPGIRSSLSTGLDMAKGLSVAWQVPLVGVHHMQAHALTPRLVHALERSKLHGQRSHGDTSKLHHLQPSFPFLTLLVSGGHTMLLHTHSLLNHTIAANTCDIALGDALDKVARHVLPPSILASAKTTMYGALLETFAFPDGPAEHQRDYRAPPTKTAHLNRQPSQWGWSIPVPFGTGMRTNAMEYSFSGIVSAVERIVKQRNHESFSDNERRDLAREAMVVAFEHVASRIVLALEAAKVKAATAAALHAMRSDDAQPAPEPTPSIPDTLVLSGGVAANAFLHTVITRYLSARSFTQPTQTSSARYPMTLITPPASLCTDNAAMIAWAGVEMYAAGWRSDLSIRAVRRWSMDSSEGNQDGSVADDDVATGILGVDGWLNVRNDGS